MGTTIDPFEAVASLRPATGVPTAFLAWDGLEAGTAYEWYVLATDGRKQVRTPVQTFVSAPSTYTSWRADHFSLADSTGGAHEDPDGDGHSNWKEYLFGGNPLVADGSHISLTPWGSDLRLVYQRRAGTGYSWTCEYSDDLQTWRPISGDELSANVVEALSEKIESVQLDLIWNRGERARFWRLQPWLP
jgi:hypothetical protein